MTIIERKMLKITADDMVTFALNISRHSPFPLLLSSPVTVVFVVFVMTDGPVGVFFCCCLHVAPVKGENDSCSYLL